MEKIKLKSSTKGFMLLNEIDTVRRRKGEKGIKELKEELRMTELAFSSFGDYPEELEAKLISAACKILFGEDSDKTQLEFGRLVYKNYSFTTAGKVIKTAVALFGKNPKKLIMAAPKVIGSTSSGVLVEVFDLEKNKSKVAIRNLAFNPNFYAGQILEMADEVKIKMKINIKQIVDKNYEFIIEWEKPKLEPALMPL